jgi:hypothetical protein
VSNEGGATFIYINLSSEFSGMVDLTFQENIFYVYLFLEPTLLLEQYNSSSLFYVRPTSLLGFLHICIGFLLLREYSILVIGFSC